MICIPHDPMIAMTRMSIREKSTLDLACRRILVLIALTSLMPLRASAEERPTSLEILPSSISLTGPRDRQGIVVLFHGEDGSTRDVTASARFDVKPRVASVTSGFVSPSEDGSGELSVEYADQVLRVPVKVTGSHDPIKLDFRNDVLPVLTKSGCNTGKCHGSAAGKDGFRLSLFGYDPAGDYYRLTRETGGRRIQLADPDHSLLVNKALGRVNHTGGQLFDEGSESHAILLHWLTAGAQSDAEDAPKPTSIDVFPPEAIFSSSEQEHRIVVRANYSDGSDRDVTRFTVFVGNNDSAATVSPAGIVSSHGAGEAFILARFDKFTAGTSVIVRPGTPFHSPETPAHNAIDELVYEKLNKLHVEPSPLCSDEVFLRRVNIDLAGLLPTSAEQNEFLRDTDPDKRTKVIDRLLARREFLDLWIMRLGELLQLRSNNGMSDKGLLLYDRWLRDQVHQGKPLDELLAELLQAQGGTFENPAVNYFQTETSPQILAENIAQVFLGTRIQCAQCHNHPFDRWTMDDYYGFASFFSQVGYKIAQDPRELTVFNTGTGQMFHPVDKQAVAPKYLGGEVPSIQPGEDYRAVLVRWLASKENPAFARNFANIVWSHFFGRGIVEPVDDARVSNPASNAALLNELARRSANYKFDVRQLARDICMSRTYQQVTQTNPTNARDQRNFARQIVRRMRAEVLLDCINQVTETTTDFAGLPLGGRAIEVPGGRSMNYFLETFGRSPRSTACSCDVKTSPTLSQALHLLNGETTTNKIATGRVVETLLAKMKPMDVAAELYRRCYGRAPTAEESTAIAQRIPADDPRPALEDMFWALLNSNEFLFNH
ncbi:DUF1549 and DUF1553 domain-containing protein [bacterium]|nr:DUF1549 and DUF1553 domain-containing protein [bacterium]